MHTGDILCYYCFKRLYYKTDSHSNPICKRCAVHLASTLRYKNRPIGRNQMCPCGSGTKFKKCCMNNKIREVLPAETKDTTH